MKHEPENKARGTHADVRFARVMAHLFNPDFPLWLERNMAIWDGFRKEADRVRRRRDHYSARTIIEWLRHDTLLSECGGDYKINNNATRDLARLYMLTTPGADGFFELREWRA